MKRVLMQSHNMAQSTVGCMLHTSNKAAEKSHSANFVHALLNRLPSNMEDIVAVMMACNLVS